MFFDGKDKPDNHCEGPQLLHFRNATIIICGQNEAWQAILKGEIQIPAECIWNKEGQLITQASATKPVMELSLDNRATNSGDSEKANQIVSQATIFVTGDHETEVTRPNILHDISNIEHQTVATEPATHHDAPDTSDLEHQTEVTEPNTHDATNLENQTEMTEPDMHTATDHTVNKENSVPIRQHESNPKSKLCVAISKVIGVDKDLVQLNSLYLKLKQMKQSHIKPPHHFVESYLCILARFKHKTLKQRAVIRAGGNGTAGTGFMREKNDVTWNLRYRMSSPSALL